MADETTEASRVKHERQLVLEAKSKGPLATLRDGEAGLARAALALAGAYLLTFGLRAPLAAPGEQGLAAAGWALAAASVRRLTAARNPIHPSTRISNRLDSALQKSGKKLSFSITSL